MQRSLKTKNVQRRFGFWLSQKEDIVPFFWYFEQFYSVSFQKSSNFIFEKQNSTSLVM